jgi:hypothetical protein
MSQDVHIAVYLVPPEDLPGGEGDVAYFIRDDRDSWTADFYCSEAAPPAARRYIADLITAIRGLQLI